VFTESFVKGGNVTDSTFDLGLDKASTLVLTEKALLFRFWTSERSLLAWVSLTIFDLTRVSFFEWWISSS
jgi:hypothetical protein